MKLIASLLGNPCRDGFNTLIRKILPYLDMLMNVTSIPLSIYDMHHEKTDLKVFVDVIPKEGLAGWGPTNPSLGVTTTLKCYSTTFIDYIL